MLILCINVNSYVMLILYTDVNLYVTFRM